MLNIMDNFEGLFGVLKRLPDEFLNRATGDEASIEIAGLSGEITSEIAMVDL